MSELTTVSAYNLAFEPEFGIIDQQTGLPFDVDAYARMKYGDRRATVDFAKDIAEALATHSPRLIEDEEPPQFLAAYKAVPHAAFFVASYALHFINSLRLDNYRTPGSLVKVHKSKTMTVNYAAESEEARENAYREIEFHMDALVNADSHAVIIDDARVTGTAEKKFLGIFQDMQPRFVALGYVAMFDPNNSQHSPSVENTLNGTDSIRPNHLLDLIHTGHFDLNIRTLNMILSSDAPELIGFLEKCPRRLIEKMFQGTVESGPEFVAHHKTGLHCLQLVAEGL